MKTLQSEYINVNGSLLDLSQPRVMGNRLLSKERVLLMSVPTLRAQTLRMYLPERKWNVYAWGWAS